MKNLVAGIAACAVMAATPASAQTVDQAKQLMDVWLEAQLDYNDWPSVAVALVNKDGTVYSNAYGYANPAGGVKATTDTLYSICSISKLFTSIAVMQQRDAGKVSLRDPVGKHLDWYEIKQKYPLSDEVTIEGILSHSSGLPREVDTPYWSRSEGYPFPARQEAIEITKGQETLYRAWEHFQYSNLGLTLAGEVVAAVSGEDYNSYVRKNVLDPLGMANTFPEMDEGKHGKELAVGHGAPPRKGDREVIPYFNAGAIGPAAGFTSTANDLAKFVSWQLKLQDGEGDGVLNHNTLREMQRPHSVIMGWNRAFGIGFSISKNDQSSLIGHGGYCPGYQSQVFIDPAKKIGGTALINAAGTRPYELVKTMFNIFDAALKSSKKKAMKKEEGSAETKSFKEYEGIYDSQPWADEVYYMQWGKNLVTIPLAAEQPLKRMTKLKHIEGDTFARMRRDGSEAEHVRFLRDADGKVTGIKWHGSITRKKS